MLDLFSANRTTEERLADLKKEIKQYQEKLGIDSKKTKVKLFLGNIEHINDGVLVVSDPPKARFFETNEDKLLVSTLESFGFDKYFITYNYLILGGSTTKEVKEFGYYIKKLVDIINPKIIVCMGETSQFCFFKRKFLLSDFHGKQIGDHESIPIMTTYPQFYYEERSKYEDMTYKNELKKSDWNEIKKKYLEKK